MRRSVRLAKLPLHAALQAVASKSETHRAVVAAALADGLSAIRSPLDADDTRVTCEGLMALGVPIERTDREWQVRGRAGLLPGAGRLDLRESGTSLRLLTAVATLSVEPSHFDGTQRLRERPIAGLVKLLNAQGARLLTAAGGGLPMTVGGPTPRGGTIRVPSAPTSQFVSALMLIGPCLEHGLDLHLEPPAVSTPYLELTAAVMREFGAAVKRLDDRHWRVEASGYRATRFDVGGDHSSASYFLAAPLLVGGRVRIEGLDPQSRQADACLGTILADLGARVVRGQRSIEVQADALRAPAFDLSLGHAPDLVPTLAVLAAFCKGTSRIRDVAHLRVKESDRLRQLAQNLGALGCEATLHDDGLSVHGGGALRAAVVDTAGDHRIAMAFALAGLRVAGVKLDDGACVAKSYPRFWADWNSMIGDEPETVLSTDQN